jgi:hypothetical protein
MLARMEMARRSRVVRLAMLFAACLTSASAFGLHPEPGADLARSPHATTVGLPSAAAVDAAPHDCLACRAHRPLVSTPILTVAAPSRRTAPRAFVSSPSVVARFDPAQPDGRAPPDLS